MTRGLAKNEMFEQAGAIQDKSSALEERIKEMTKNPNVVEKAKRDAEQEMRAHKILKYYCMQGGGTR